MTFRIYKNRYGFVPQKKVFGKWMDVSVPTTKEDADNKLRTQFEGYVSPVEEIEVVIER